MQYMVWQTLMRSNLGRNNAIPSYVKLNIIKRTLCKEIYSIDCKICELAESSYRIKQVYLKLHQRLVNCKKVKLRARLQKLPTIDCFHCKLEREDSSSQIVYRDPK